MIQHSHDISYTAQYDEKRRASIALGDCVFGASPGPVGDSVFKTSSASSGAGSSSESGTCLYCNDVIELCSTTQVLYSRKEYSHTFMSPKKIEHVQTCSSGLRMVNRRELGTL